MRVRWSARTHVGMRREINQDAYGQREFADRHLLVVCDGMGGHAAGEVASQLGVETIVASLAERADQPADEAIRHALEQANAQIFQQGHGTMGTTGVLVLVAQNTAYVGNVGDSRAYLLRDGGIEQISRDHSLVYDQVASGLITPEEARNSNMRNIITRALGHQAEVEVDLFTRPLQDGDLVLLSSDGMHGLIEDAEIAEIVSLNPLQEAVDQLVALANERGGIDNITVAALQIDQADPAAPEPKPSTGVTRPFTAAPTDRLAAAAPPAERKLSRLGVSLALLLCCALFVAAWAAAQITPLPPLQSTIATVRPTE